MNRKQITTAGKKILGESFQDRCEITNAFNCGEVNTTLLAEQIVSETELDESALDDECHDLWDVCFELSEWWDGLSFDEKNDLWMVMAVKK